MDRPDPSRRVALARGFETLTVATFALIVLGAVVRAKGAGLACPDWPLCFGELVPRLDVKIALEWGHRVLAGTVTLGLALLTWAARGEPRARAPLTGLLALAWLLLGVQVVLGGLTVLVRLAPWTVTSHLLCGSAFCAVLFWSARELREPEPRRDTDVSTAARAAILVVAALVVLQIALGGLVSSHAAGLACAHFPTCDGSAWAPSLRGLIGLHVLHRIGGYAVAAGFGSLVLATRRSGRTGSLARSGLRLVIVQIALGAANVVMRLPIEVTALHSATAAGLVLVTTLLVREWWRSRSREAVRETGRLEAARAA